MDTNDVLYDVEFYAGNDDLHSKIINALPDIPWVRKPFWTLPEEERLLMSWENFAAMVKHRVRYLMFPDTPDSEKTPDSLVPTQVLDMIGDNIRDHGLLATIPAGTILYRVRIHKPGLKYSTIEELGPPPSKASRFSNRMSPAGISLLYVSLDQETAISETWVRKDENPEEVTIAQFKLTEDILILNLVNLPEVPSIFEDQEKTWRRPFLKFLNRFVRNLTEKVEKDGREHVEYTPSQVVTEYFRYRFRSNGNQAVRGILYPSAARSGGQSCVLFVSYEDLNDKYDFGKPIAFPISFLSDKTECRRLKTNIYNKKGT